MCVSLVQIIVTLFFSALFLYNPDEFYRVGIKMMMTMVMMMIIINI